MRLFAACALLLLAGCVGAPEEPGRVVVVDGPRLASILPDAATFPAGFYARLDPDPDEAERAGTMVRIYDHAGNNATVQHSLTVGVDRVESPERAAQACAVRAAGAAPGEDGLFIVRQGWGDASTVVALGCEGVHAVWAMESARGEAGLLDVAELARGMLARARG